MSGPQLALRPVTDPIAILRRPDGLFELAVSASGEVADLGRLACFAVYPLGSARAFADWDRALAAAVGLELTGCVTIPSPR